MRRGVKIAGWIGAALVALPLLVLGGLLALANTGPGRTVVAEFVGWASGGEIVLNGLGGRFPDRLEIAQVELRDAQGGWAQIEELTLDWAPLRLLAGELRIAELHAAQAELRRLPRAESKEPARNAGATLPLAMAIERVVIDRFGLSAALAGTPASLRLDGFLHATDIDHARFALTAERLDAAGRYSGNAAIAPEGITAHLDIAEPARGLVGGFANLPGIGPLSLSADLAGPRAAETFRLALSAGALRLDGGGTIDLAGERLDIALNGSAPGLALSPDLDWRSVALDARIVGPFSAPQASGGLDIRALRAGAARFETLTAKLRGRDGKVALTAEATGLELPGPQPDLLAAAPVKLEAEARLDAPARPVTFRLSHPLLVVEGHADTAPTIAAEAEFRLPDLAAVGRLAQVALNGAARFTARLTVPDTAARHLAVDGVVSVTGGDARIAGALGRKATLALAATQLGESFMLDHFALDGKALRASAAGRGDAERLDLAWKAELSDLKLLTPELAGRMTAEGRVTGALDDMTVRADASVDLAVAGLPPGTVTMKIEGKGLPRAPSGTISAQGRLADAPLQLAAAVRRASDGTINLSLQRTAWKSIDARGELALPSGSLLPQGNLALSAGNLADLRPILGTELAGRIEARFDTAKAEDGLRGRLQLEGRNIAIAGTSVERVALAGTIGRVASDDPVLALRLALDRFATDDLSGDLSLHADGPLSAARLRLHSTLNPTGRERATIDAAATARVLQRTVRVETLRVIHGDETLRLLAPARLDFADGVAVDRLRLGIRDATLDAVGRISPELDLRLALRGGAAALAAPLLPEIAPEGTLSAQATLRGTLDAPIGTLRLSGRNLRARSGSGAALPPLGLDATAELDGRAARIEGKLEGGEPIRLTVSGRAPLSAEGQLDLRTAGRLDLAVFNPLLAGGGRSVRGGLTIDLAVTGTLARPDLAGSAQIAEGEVQDYVQGIHVAGITGSVDARERRLEMKLTGRAGQGTVTASATMDLASPGLPLTATIAARAARLPASDFITAQIDADLTLRGAAAERLNLAGTTRVARADIHIPDKLPASVAVLDVRTPGETPPTETQPLVLVLDLTIDAPEQIFVRGYGLDVEIGGRLTIAGESDQPRVGGGFDLRRGTFSLAGQTLRFTSGRVSFDGTGLAGKLNPTLDLVAEKKSASITARLTVTGYADAPRIVLSSTPELPQDEVLAHLLFGRSTKQLTPLQLAEIAQALASLGSGGDGFNPLATVRKGLGLDVLSVGGGSGAAPTAGAGAGMGGTTVEAGKYITEGVYLGTEQAVSGAGRAKVRIDLTDRLKLESTVGTGSTGPATGATPDNDPGSSIGLTYEFEY